MLKHRFILSSTILTALSLLATSCTMHLQDESLECSAGECLKAKVCQNPTMMSLAADLDWVDQRIDHYGSVVAKQPDLWGQPRFTKYREQYEKLMAADAKEFKFALQGATNRSDQAFVANAVAISQAISSQQAGVRPPPRVYIENKNDADYADAKVIETPAATIESGVFDAFSNIKRTDLAKATLPGFAKSGDGISIEPVEFLNQKARYLNHLDQLRRTNEGDDTADYPGYVINLLRVPVSVNPGRKTDRGYGAEITLTLKPVLGDDLLQTTFRQLMMNDVVDMLAMPTVRLAEHYGQVQAAQKAMNDDKEKLARGLLNYFKETEKEINSSKAVLKKLSEVAKAQGQAELAKKYDAQILDNDKTLSAMKQERKLIFENNGVEMEPAAIVNRLSEKKLEELMVQLNLWSKAGSQAYSLLSDKSFIDNNIAFLDDVDNKYVQQYLTLTWHPESDTKFAEIKKQLEEKGLASERAFDLALADRFYEIALEKNNKIKITGGLDTQRAELIKAGLEKSAKDLEENIAQGNNLKNSTSDLISKVKESLQIAKSSLEVIRSQGLSATPQKVSRLPMPFSQLREIFDEPLINTLGELSYGTLQNHSNHNHGAYYLEIQSFLQEEFQAAYDYLALPQMSYIWQWCHPTGELLLALRARNCDKVEDLRKKIKDELNKHIGKCCKKTPLTADFAWFLLVEATLLNQRLIDDMKEVAGNKNCPCLNAVEGKAFYALENNHEEKMLFNEYVQCRWPIHVFAVDPQTQDQNIADTFSMRREMQLAASLAFVTGNMNARNLTRFARRLETDLQTIALNRTHLGFSHGNETFGWRFFPRFQTVGGYESNATVLVRDLLIGGPSKQQELAQQRLEPGMRECVAIVIMPSFVPYYTCEVSSGWFRLGNAAHKEFTMTDTLKISQVLKSIETCGPQVGDQDCFRDGEHARLLNRARQLATKLPLQTMTLQTPQENTLGGFALFNSSITNLEPQLRGWYGGPGLKPDENTSLFLVGNNFSVHNTRVIAGGLSLPIDNVELLSRQVMRVTVPKGVIANIRLASPKDKQSFVDVHIATPYGVSGQLAIPLTAATSPKPDPKGLLWKPEQIDVAFIYEGKSIKPSNPPKVTDMIVELKDTTLNPDIKSCDMTFTLNAPYKDVTFKVPNVAFDKAFKFNEATLTVFADELTKALKDKVGPEQINPPQEVSTLKVMLQPFGETNGVRVSIGDPKETNNQLKIKWIKAPK